MLYIFHLHFSYVSYIAISYFYIYNSLSKDGLMYELYNNKKFIFIFYISLSDLRVYILESHEKQVKSNLIYIDNRFLFLNVYFMYRYLSFCFKFQLLIFIIFSHINIKNNDYIIIMFTNVI